jgi:hypothetical protein
MERRVIELKNKQAALVRQWTEATKTGKVREAKEAQAAALMVTYEIRGVK